MIGVWTELIVGTLVGAFLGAVLAVGLMERGRHECERDLPRSEECVQQWVPARGVSK